MGHISANTLVSIMSLLLSNTTFLEASSFVPITEREKKIISELMIMHSVFLSYRVLEILFTSFYFLYYLNEWENNKQNKLIEYPHILVINKLKRCILDSYYTTTLLRFWTLATIA